MTGKCMNRLKNALNRHGLDFWKNTVILKKL